jgi:hypothetical protein
MVPMQNQGENLQATFFSAADVAKMSRIYRVSQIVISQIEEASLAIYAFLEYHIEADHV